MNRMIGLLLAMTLLPAAMASDVRPADSLTRLEDRPGTVAIICPTDRADERFVSRGFAIASAQGAMFDIILATRHATGNVTGGSLSDCRVRAPGGLYVAIAGYRQSVGYGDEGDDWVVLRTAERLPETMTRFRLAHADSAADRLSGIAVLSSGLGDACRVRPDQVWSGQGRLFAHDCDTQPGHSGSPIVISLDGELTAIGVHIGQLMEFSTTEQMVLGVGRWIDASIEQAVMDLAASAD